MAIDCDFDRLGNLAARHGDVCMMLGHSEFGDDTTYHVQTLVDNVGLLTEEVLEEISEAVVACGHRELRVEFSRGSASVQGGFVCCQGPRGLADGCWPAMGCSALYGSGGASRL